MKDERDFIAWARELGATRVRVGNTEVEFQPRSHMEIAEQRIEEMSQKEVSMLADMAAEDRAALKEKQRNELMYHSS